MRKSPHLLKICRLMLNPGSRCSPPPTPFPGRLLLKYLSRNIFSSNSCLTRTVTRDKTRHLWLQGKIVFQSLCPSLCNPVDGSTPGSPSFPVSPSWLKLMSIELAMLSPHVILPSLGRVGGPSRLNVFPQNSRVEAYPPSGRIYRDGAFGVIRS